MAQTGHPARSVDIVITVAGDPSSMPPLEVCALPDNRRIGLTTMWDDGPGRDSPGGGDLRLADTLWTNGWKGTFGWCLLSEATRDTSEILARGMEICSHTSTHPFLWTRSRNTVFWELLTSKIYFSLLAQKPVVSYADAFLAHDPVIDREISQAGFLVARGGGGSYSIDDFSRRLLLPATYLVGVGTNEYRGNLEDLFATADEGTVQGMWGHAYRPEFDEDIYAQFVPLLQHYRQRPDAWHATWAELGSQMFLRHATHVGQRQIGNTTVRYSVTIDPLPRDLVSIPLTLRVRGTADQLLAIRQVTIDGIQTQARWTETAVLIDVAPFSNNLYANAVTATFTEITNATLQQAVRALPAITNSEIDAVWIWKDVGEVHLVDVGVTNKSSGVLKSVALEVLASSAWSVITNGIIPTQVTPGHGFQASYTIAPLTNENIGGWTAFAARLDYTTAGRPSTHYLVRDMALPISISMQHAYPAPNMKIAGPIPGTASHLTEILQAAEGKWTNLRYDSSDRPSIINLTRIYFPDLLLSPGVRVLSTYLVTDTARQGVMKFTQRYQLSGVRFWLEGNELFYAGVGYPFALHPGQNRLVVVCDAISDIVPYYLGPTDILELELLFFGSDGETPLSEVLFTAGNQAVISLEPATGRLLLTWVTIPGKRYRIERKNSLDSEAWTPVGAEEMAVGDSLTRPIDGENRSQGFFRVVGLD